MKKLTEDNFRHPMWGEKKTYDLELVWSLSESLSARIARVETRFRLFLSFPRKKSLTHESCEAFHSCSSSIERQWLSRGEQMSSFLQWLLACVNLIKSLSSWGGVMSTRGPLRQHRHQKSSQFDLRPRCYSIKRKLALCHNEGSAFSGRKRLEVGFFDSSFFCFLLIGGFLVGFLIGPSLFLYSQVALVWSGYG